jgi:hypothetical protein
MADNDHIDDSSSVTSESDELLMQQISQIFLPTLCPDYYKPISPYDNIIPLMEADFTSDPSLSLIHLTDLSSLHDIIAPGFKDGACINREQWLRTMAQLFAVALKGFSNSHPDKATPDFLTDLGPDEAAALNGLSTIMASFNQFFDNPTSLNPSEWDQCLRCLKVNHLTVTQDHYEARLKDTNQNVDTARMTILNTKIREFEWEIVTWVDSQRQKTMNQVMEAVIGSNHPPFTADPRIIEFIQREAEALAEHTHREAVTQAKCNAKQAYDTAREQADALHTKDLNAIREHTDKALAEACSESEIEITTFKADLKAQRTQCKADLEQDAILARCMPKKPRPDLINTSRSRHDTSRSTSRCPSPSRSMIKVMEPMMVDTNEPLDPQVENSPTPTSAICAPIPCVSEAPSNAPTDKLDDLITMMQTGFDNMGKLVDSKLEKALTPINSRLQQLKGAPCQLDDYFPN